ncbi:pentapeptide repeat-containing protein, partial [Mycobacterium sp. MS3]
TGSFNVGDTNTGDLNPGDTNTGWLNSGDANTGFANSGSVNTGAFISGNYSNGILWRGEYQGLFSYSYNLDIPQIPLVDAHVAGGFGPVVLPPIPIPSTNLHLSGNVAMGEFIIPEINIAIPDPNITGIVNIGPFTLPSVSIPSISATIHQIVSASVGAYTKIDPIEIWTNDPTVTFYSIGGNSGVPYATGQIVMGPGFGGGSDILVNAATRAFNTPVISVGQIPVGFRVPGSIDALTLFPGGLRFGNASLLNLDVIAGTQAVTIPSITWPEISANVDGTAYVIASHVRLIDVPLT